MNDTNEHLENRCKTIKLKLGRIRCIDISSNFQFEKMLNNLFVEKHSFYEIIQSAQKDEKLLLEVEKIIERLEIENGINYKTDLIVIHAKPENRLCYVIDYSDDQLKSWLHNKIQIGIDNILNIIINFYNSRCAILQIKDEVVQTESDLDRIIVGKNKKILIDAVIKCTVGYDYFYN